MEDEAQLVSADNGRQDDSACRPAPDGKARRRDRRRGQGQSRDLRVATAGGREPDREGRQRRAGDGSTLAGGVRRIMSNVDVIRCIKIKTAKHHCEMRSRHVFKRHSIPFVAALVAALATFVGGPNAAPRAAPQQLDQAPGFYRLKVGDLEVTALFDGTGVFDPGWLNGTTATMNGVQEALQKDPHVLDV